MKKCHGNDDTIRIGWEIQCLPYAGFFKYFINHSDLKSINEFVHYLHLILTIYGRNQSGCEKAKYVGFLPFILLVFLTIYIWIALMKITMCFI